MRGALPEARAALRSAAALLSAMGLLAALRGYRLAERTLVVVE